MPKISVVMSVYKEPVDWMRQSIDSILNQTYTDFEFIIINDKPDREENARLLNEYAQKDNRIKIITNEENIGLTKSLNIGISVAKGEYIARMDADDIADASRLRVQLDFLENNPDIDLCSTCLQHIDQNGRIIKINIPYERYEIYNIFRRNIITHSAVMFRSKLLNLRKPLYNENYISSQDIELWNFFYLKGIKMHVLKEKLLSYRLSDSNISATRRSEQAANSRTARIELINKFLFNNSIIDVSMFGNWNVMINRIEDFLCTKGNLKKELNSILFVLYMTMIADNPKKLFAYILNKNFYVFRWSMHDNYHILLLPFHKNKWRSLYL